MIALMQDQKAVDSIVRVINTVKSFDTEENTGASTKEGAENLSKEDVSYDHLSQS